MNIKQFNDLKNQFGEYSSFALWAEPDKNSKIALNNIGNLSIFNNCIKQINDNYVFVALNAASHSEKPNIKKDFHSFHSEYSDSKDYILRNLFSGTQASGAYITDLIKEDLDGKIIMETESSIVKKLIKNNPNIEAHNIDLFNKELNIIKANVKIIAFGRDSYEILNKWFREKKLAKNVVDIRKTYHFSYHYVSYLKKKESFDKVL